MRKLLVFVAMFLGAGGVAQADAIYDWHTVSGGMPRDVSMKVVFSNGVVNKGSFDLTVDVPNTHGPIQSPGLLSMDFYATEMTQMSYLAGSNNEAGWPISINMNVSFTKDGYLNGKIVFNDGQSDFGMSSNGNLFSFYTSGSDFDPPGTGVSCDRANPPIANCTWATGELVREQSDGDDDDHDHKLPEPGSVALMCLAGVGMVAMNRRSSKKA